MKDHSRSVPSIRYWKQDPAHNGWNIRNKC